MLRHNASTRSRTRHRTLYKNCCYYRRSKRNGTRYPSSIPPLPSEIRANLQITEIKTLQTQTWTTNGYFEEMEFTTIPKRSFDQPWRSNSIPKGNISYASVYISLQHRSRRRNKCGNLQPRKMHHTRYLHYRLDQGSIRTTSRTLQSHYPRNYAC